MSDHEIRWLDLFTQGEPPRGESTEWPEGLFVMSVDNATIGFTVRGYTKLLITFLCKQGERAGLSYEWHLTCNPENPRYFLERIKTLGAPPEFLLANPSLGEVCQRIISTEKLYHVTFGRYNFNGESGVKISWLENYACSDDS